MYRNLDGRGKKKKKKGRGKVIKIRSVKSQTRQNET